MSSLDFTINGVDYLVDVKNHRRRNSTVSISENIVKIRLSTLASPSERERHLQEFLEWTKKRIKKSPDRFRPKERRSYKDQDTIQIGDEKYALRIDYEDRKTGSFKSVGNIIRLKVPETLSEEDKNKMVSELLAKAVSAKRLPALFSKISILNNMFFQKNIKQIRFRNMKSRWGSCSKDGKISISSRLLLAPEKVLEYVCIHELAHLVHFNHSKRFWALVEKVMPEYKAHEKWLLTHGENCYF